eukprot:SAG25_NODE_1438_length_3023_cov_1.870041_4_plen_91_part_00
MNIAEYSISVNCCGMLYYTYAHYRRKLKVSINCCGMLIAMVIKGPGITPGTQFTLPASNVDVAPTLLGLAGVDAWAAGARRCVLFGGRVD